jgi:cell division protein FtsZ
MLLEEDANNEIIKEDVTPSFSDTVEEVKEETTIVDHDYEDEMTKYVLNEDQDLDHSTSDETLEPQVTENTTIHQPKLEDDGKIRFLLEDDENLNPEMDLQDEKEPTLENLTVENNNSEDQPHTNEDKTLESREVSQERIERIRKATEKLRSPLGLNEMESEPAYKRRNIDLKDVKYSDDSSSSKYTLWENINDSGEKESGLSDNNSFLHDNVD